MPEVPEPEKELKPIFRDERKQPGLPCPDKVPVPAMPSAGGVQVIASRAWVGCKHFVEGFSIGATVSLVAGAHPYLAVGLGVAGGIAATVRKTVKDSRAEAGDKFPDLLDKLLKIILAILEAIKKRKGGTHEND